MSTTDLYCYGLTPWQLNWCQLEERKKDFRNWLHVEGIRPGDRQAGPIVMMYFGKEGGIHSISLDFYSVTRRIYLKDGAIVRDSDRPVGEE